MHNKKKVLLIIGIVLLCLASAVVGLFIGTNEDIRASLVKFDWYAYLSGDFLQIASLALVAVLGNVIASKPTLSGLKGAADAFASTVGTVNGLAADTAKNNARYSAIEKYFSEAKAVVEKSAIETRETVASMTKKVDAVEEMVRLGFGHMSELVAKGYAKKIWDIAEHEREEAANSETKN